MNGYNFVDDHYYVLASPDQGLPVFTGYYTPHQTVPQNMPQTDAEQLTAAYLLQPFDYSAYPNWSFPPTQNDMAYMPATEYEQPILQPEALYQGLPLHAPVPISSYSTLISPVSAPPTPEPSTSEPPSPTDYSFPSSQESAFSALDMYASAPQVTFQTPSELLSDIASRERDGVPLSESRSSPEAERSASPEPAEDRDDAGETSRPCKKAKNSVKAQETQRKAYFRAVAESVGFQPTDPDTITSHDKKRSYLECLERYVQWLHEQIRVVGHEPVPLERVSTYRGLTSRSIRTLLVHMQDESRKLHQQTLEDEQTFIQLEELVNFPTPDALHAFRRHSVPTDSRLPPFFAARR